MFLGQTKKRDQRMSEHSFGKSLVNLKLNLRHGVLFIIFALPKLSMLTKDLTFI